MPSNEYEFTSPSQNSSTFSLFTQTHAQQNSGQVRENARRRIIENRFRNFYFWTQLILSVLQLAPNIFVVVATFSEGNDGLLKIFLWNNASCRLADFIVLIYYRCSTQGLTPLMDPAIAQMPEGYIQSFMNLFKELTVFFSTLGTIAAVFVVFACFQDGVSPLTRWFSFYLALTRLVLAIVPPLMLLLLISCLPCILRVANRIRPNPSYPATKQYAATLPTIKYEPGKTEYDAITIKPEDANCCICLQEYAKGASIRILKCNHHFHEKCSDQWFVQQATCPLCIAPVRPFKVV